MQSLLGMYDNFGIGGCRDDSSASDECERDTVSFIVGSGTNLQQLTSIKSPGSISLSSTPSTSSQQQLALATTTTPTPTTSSSSSSTALPSISNQLQSINDR